MRPTREFFTPNLERFSKPTDTTIQSTEYPDDSGREHAGHDTPASSSDLARSFHPFDSRKSHSMIVGQIAYKSRISRRTEYKPLSVGLIGAKGMTNHPQLASAKLRAYGGNLGSDLMLAKLAKEAFESSG